MTRVDQDFEEVNARLNRRGKEIKGLDVHVKEIMIRLKEREEEAEEMKDTLRSLSHRVLALEDKGHLDEGTSGRIMISHYSH